MQWFINAIREHAELALFLTLALGHGAGQLRLGSFQIGPVLGCLFAGVVVGQLDIPVPEALKNTFFVLFLFAIGYNTGPIFFRGLKSTAGPQIGLTVLLCVTALLTAWAVSWLFGFDAGAAGGLIGGAMTSAASLGTASDAVLKLGLDPAQVSSMAASRTVAFAVTYLSGMSLVIWLLAYMAPRLLRVDLAAECRRLEVEMGVDDRADESLTAYSAVVARVYAIPARLAGLSVADVEALFTGQRVFIERVRQAGHLIDEPSAALQLGAGDRVVLSARIEHLGGAGNPLHEGEVDDPELLRIPMATVNVVLTRKELAHRTLAYLAEELGARGVFLRRLMRAGLELPFTPRTLVERGDVLEIFGAKRNLVRSASRLGYAEWPSNATDLGSISLAMLLGGLLGLPVIALGRVDLGLSLFVGVLLAGLVFGWLRSLYPRFGRIPTPALWIFDSLGLTGFLALVGMGVGPGFVSGVTESGLSLIIAGVIVTTVPHLVTLLVGRYVLKLHPGILIGVCCGAGTSAAALAAVQKVADSRIPALGYGVGCALGNVLLALWGGIIVLLVSW